MPELLKRSITGLIFVLVLIGAIVSGSGSFAMLFLVVSLLGVGEFYFMARKAGHNPSIVLGLGISALLYISVWSAIENQPFMWSVFSAILLTVFIFLREIRQKHPHVQHLMFTFGGLLYWMLPMLSMLWLPHVSGAYNPHIVLGFFILLWCNDTGAYLVGSKWGKRRLAPALSPKKSWEGFIGGGVVVFVAAFVLARYFPVLEANQWGAVALIVFALATPGDLLESMIKRNFGVKDSGRIMPGHGGVLDRFDGTTLSLPVVLAYLYFFY